MIPATMLRQLDRLSLVSRRRQVVQLHGERRGRSRGSSLEFNDYRGYVAGDDIRRVDWNLYGRSQELFVKQFEDERALGLHLLIDVSRSMDFGEPNKLRFAAQLVAALAYVGLVGISRVTVGALRDDAEIVFGPSVGRSRFPALVNALGALEGRGETDLARAAGSFWQRQRASGLAVLVSDLLSPTWQDGIRSLVSHRDEVVVLHTLAPDELEPTPAEEVRLIDRETGRALEARLDRAALDRYHQRLSQWCSDVEAYCLRSGIRYQRLSTGLPLDEVVLSRLTGGGILR